MPRALTAEWLTVPAAGREAELARWRALRKPLAAAGARLWLFESPGDGAILAFTEAADAGVLRAARAGAGLPADQPILTEVELS